MTCITDLQFSKHRRADHQGPHILYMGSDLLRPARGSHPASYLASQTDCDPATICRRTMFAQRQLPQCCSSKPNIALLTLCQPRGGQEPSATAVVVFLSSKFQIKHAKTVSDKHGPAKIHHHHAPQDHVPSIAGTVHRGWPGGGSIWGSLGHGTFTPPGCSLCPVAS